LEKLYLSTIGDPLKPLSIYLKLGNPKMDPLTNLTTKREATAASWEKLNLSAAQCLKYDDDIVDGANSGGIHFKCNWGE
jgi:hypothetical protein